MKKIMILGYLILSLAACEKDDIVAPSTYACTLSFADNSLTHPKHSALQAELVAFAEQTPGVQIAVRLKDGTTWTNAAGMADIPNGVPFQPCTKTMIGSISKVITGTLIFRLQDQGLLDVNDPLSKWLGDDLIADIANAKEATLIQLLNHTSGIPDYLAAKQHLNSINNNYFKETQKEKLRYVHGKKAVHELGSIYSYSNTNYVLLGLVIEEATGKTLWDVVRDELALPLGLQNFEMGTHDNPIPTGTARPYLALRKGEYSDIMHFAVSDAATGDGGISSNMQDMAAFFTALFEGEIIATESLEQMTTTLTPTVDGSTFGLEKEFYGLGIEKYETTNGDAYGHQGSTSGYEAYSIHYPASGVGVHLAFNGIDFQDAQDGLRRELLFRLVDLALE